MVVPTTYPSWSWKNFPVTKLTEDKLVTHSSPEGVIPMTLPVYVSWTGTRLLGLSSTHVPNTTPSMSSLFVPTPAVQNIIVLPLHRGTKVLPYTNQTNLFRYQPSLYFG